MAEIECLSEHVTRHAAGFYDGGYDDGWHRLSLVYQPDNNKVKFVYLRSESRATGRHSSILQVTSSHSCASKFRVRKVEARASSRERARAF